MANETEANQKLFKKIKTEDIILGGVTNNVGGTKGNASYYFFRKVGILSPASDEAINIPSLFNRVSSFLALIIHQTESLL